MGFIVIPGVDVADADALVGDVLNPKTFYSVAPPRKTGTMPTVALAMGSNAYPAGYHVGDAMGLNHIEHNLQPAFVAAGIDIFGTVGTHGYFDRILPATIGGVNATAIVTVDQSVNKSLATLSTPHVESYIDAPASMIKRLTPTIASTDAQNVIAAADQNHNENAPIAGEAGFQMLIEGAVADDGGVETDETAAARSPAANDMTLLPAVPAVGDAYMLGSSYKAHRFWINIGTAGAGNWTLSMKYWDGGAWVACVDEVENSAQFMTSGMRYWQHTPQGDWALKVIQGKNLYWVRIEVTNYVNIVTQPLGTQSWWEVLA